MGRPQKNGIDYFSFDCGFFGDKKIKSLKAHHGSDGITLYIYLLCEIYKDKGYYLIADDELFDTASDDLHLSVNNIGLIVNFLLKRSLFDDKLFQSDKILTSKGIQKRYQEAVKTRALKNPVSVEEKFWILSEDETQSFIKVRHKKSNSEKNHSNSKKNGSFSMEKSTKESKGKKSKEKESKVVVTEALPPPASAAEIIAFIKAEQLPFSTEKGEYFFRYYEAADWKDCKGRSINWKQKLIEWARREHTDQQSSNTSVSYDIEAFKKLGYDLPEPEEL